MNRGRIVILSGPLKGRTYEVAGDLTIGRSHDNTLQINDLQVSRRHALIQQTAQGVLLRDLGSGNGTYVGQQRILEHRLAPGDVIQVGPVQLRFDAETGAQAAPGAKAVTFASREGSENVQASAAASVYKTFFDTAGGGQPDAQLREAQQRLAAVYEATQIISSERDLTRLYARIMDQLFRLVPAHNGVLLVRDPKTGTVLTEHVKRRDGSTDEIVVSSTVASCALERGEAVVSYDASSDDRFESGQSIIAQNITSVICAPLEHQGEILGALYLDTRGSASAFKPSDLELLVAVARAAAIALRNAQYLRQVEQGYHDTITVLANAIEMRDHYTVGHTWRVTNISMAVGRKLGWGPEKLRECEWGGILHDVGKIAIDNAILGKTSKLSDEEYAKMKVHPERGARMMRDVEFLIPLIPYALYHHERWDGKGYPYGLKGEEIPLEGRVVAVADTWDAMTSNRPYRRGLDADVALGRIQQGSGTQFDPACVQALTECYEDGTLLQVMQNYYEQDGRSIACPFCSTYIRVPDHIEPGDETACGVCHRRLRVECQNDVYYGELLAETEPELSAQTPPPPTDST